MFSPSEIMQYRWLKQLQCSPEMPDMDLDDINKLLDNPQHSRQFAPEYAQKVYQESLKHDTPLGNYLQEIHTDIIEFDCKDRERLMTFV